LIPKSRAGFGQGSLASSSTPRQSTPLLRSTALDANAASRVGFGMAVPADPVLWAGRLGAAWYLDWTSRPAPSQPSPEHWQMVRIAPPCLLPSMQQIATLAAAFPGQVWILGNEPDVIWQDNVTPQLYAQAYHDIYHLVKQADPTAQIAVAGISQATPLRLAYLDQVLQAYLQAYSQPMPVDWWTVHGFVLREELGSWGVGIPPGFPDDFGMLYEVSDHASVDLFQQHIIEFRKWMHRRGYQDTPLALTEFGILMPPEYGFPVELVADYLTQTFSWLSQASSAQYGLPSDDGRLVQRWAWYSLADTIYPASNLADLDESRLTPLGQAFAAFTSRAP
ncbi:MAG: glycoside hydrolase family protein, partial [Anaerolineae bacterium]|nr:glycoside hydrolase family protein [Anaerolineae bacterium]